MKILLIGDPHFKLNNVNETKKLHDETLKIIKNDKYDFVVVLGDVLDTHEKIHVQPLCRAVNFIIDISKLSKVYVIIGNHDRINNDDFLTSIHPFVALKYVKNIVIVDDVITHDNFVFVPYVPPGRFREALSKINFDYNDSKQIIFAHQEFKGAKMGAFISEKGDYWQEDYPTVFSGHIHDFQIFQHNIVYTGTPFQHGYHDRDDKYLFNLLLDRKYDYELEKIKLKTIKKKRILQINMDQLESYRNDENYDTKLIIDGDGKIIKKMLVKKKDIEKYKIRDTTFLKTDIIDKNSLSFEQNLKQKINDLSVYDRGVFVKIQQ